MGGIFSKKGPSGFSSWSTAEEVTEGIDGTGLTAIVTGGSSGIGAETSRVLALRGVHVVMAVRNTEAGEHVKQAILTEVPDAKIDVRELDLSSLESVRKFGADYCSSGLPLNILVNNAGLGAAPFKLSKDGIEMQFATNHLGHFLLTELVLETMKRTSRESKVEGRIVNVSSSLHPDGYREGIRFDKINDEAGYNRYYAYAQSKLANLLHTNELTRQRRGNSLHPGMIFTNIGRHDLLLSCFFGVSGLFNKTKTVPQGAATSCYLALNPQVKGVSGEYFVDSNIGKQSSQAKDADLAKKLWDFSLSLTNAK
ncbi:hypothetical protein ACFX13_038891 [Malus domestica]